MRRMKSNKIEESQKTENGWEYEPKDMSMNGMPTLSKETMDGAIAYVVYDPRKKMLHFYPDVEGDPMTFFVHRNVDDFITRVRSEGQMVTAEDLVTFLF